MTRIKLEIVNDSSAWQTQCKGYGDETVGWITEEMEQPQSKTRNLVAMAKCSGCPVFDTCAFETLRMRDHGVIRAGKALNSDSHSAELTQQYDDLRKHLGKPNGDLSLRECRVCGETISSNNYPNTKQAHSLILCVDCYHQRVKEQGQ
jgi:hypothetical protein